MNEMECSPSQQSAQDSESGEDEVSVLSQRMEGSLCGSQRSDSQSHNRNATPEARDIPDRLNSIPLSDSGVFGGPEDDPTAESPRGSHSSQNSIPSQLTDNQSDTVSTSGAGQHGARDGNPYVLYSLNRRLPNSIYDSQRYPFPLRRFWHPDGLLVCTDRHREYLYSQAKCMGLAANTEKSDAYGLTWSFVFPFEGFGLPEEMISAIYFFTTIGARATHNKFNKCVIQTNNLKHNLYPSYNDKDVVGVLQGTCMDDITSDHDHVPSSADLSDLLQSCEHSSTGMSFKALPLLKMNIGITGALYNVGGKEKRRLFGVLYVHWLLNVDFMQLMMKTILAVPSVKTPNFDNVNKTRNALFDTFISLLVNQTQGITGDLAGQSPRDFLENPTGRLGAHNLCNPFWEPFKMLKTLEEGASNVRFIGYPDINWQGDPRSPEGNDLRNYINYANGYTGHMVDWCSRIQEACKEFYGLTTEAKPSRKKRRESGSDEQCNRTEFSLPVFYGFPTRLEPHSQFYQCITTFAPIFLDLRYLKVPNVMMTYHCFQINFGGIPMILQCLFRSFLFHGRAGVDSTKLDKIYLEDLDVKWNLSMLEERFYGPNSINSLQFASAGCNMKSYHDLISYIKAGVSDGSVSPYNAVQVLNRHFELCWGLYVSMVDSGAFLSDRVTLSLKMLKKLYNANQNDEVPFLTTLYDFQTRILPHTMIDFIVNPYDLAKRMILSSLVHTNSAGQLLNSINLGTKLDLLISMITYSIGQHNKTITPFGKGIEVAPCSGSAREPLVGTKGVWVVKIDNPNGSGKDYAVIKTNEDLGSLPRLLKEPESKLQIFIENDFTKTSILLRTCMQIVDGHVISSPDPMTNGVFCALTEVRGNMGDQLHILITYVYTRGEKAEQLSTTTKEEPTTKKREVVNRLRTCDIPLIMRCTNTAIPSTTVLEAYKTLVAVLHCRPPGATLYTPGNHEGKDMSSAYINRFECRSRRLSDEDEKIAAYVHTAALLAAEHVGRMNQTMFPAEINPVVIGVLDWLLYVTQVNWESIFNLICNGRRLNRLKRVYESRSAAMGLYAHTMNSLMQNDEYSVAIYKAALAFHADALPLTNCGDLLYTLIFRSLSWVPIVYARCYAIETNVPVIPVDSLIELLTDERGPPMPGMKNRVYYDSVCDWLNQCVLQHRFCINPEGDSFSEYISSSGTATGGVVENGVLRVGKDQNGWMDPDSLTVPRFLAEHTWIKYGKELEHAFALSESSLTAGIDEMLKTFQLEGKKLLGIDLNDTDRYAEFFGLSGQLPFKKRQFSNEKKPFAVQHVWAKDDTRDPKAAFSVGMGVDWLQLLMLTAFIGDSIGTKLHPQFISDFARRLTRLVLQQSPAGVTPWRFVEITSFNCYDCSLEPIDMGSCEDRPEHFLRAQNEQLAIDGILPDCPNFQNFAVEDLLAVGPLCGWAKCIGCPVWKVPAIADVTYNLRPNVAYTIYNQTSGALGFIEVSTAGVINMEYEDTARSLELNMWQAELMEAGFIVLPLITRQCACVSVGEDGWVGCLVPPTENASFNISREDRCYRAKTRVDTVQIMSPLDVMEKLLPIGTLCYLKMECQSAGPLVRRLEAPLSPNERLGCVLRVRLSSPNVKHPTAGKLYIVFVIRKGVVSTSETMVVDPWEITTEKGRRREIEHLIP